MPLELTDKGIAFIASWENCILQAYDDATEKPVPEGGECKGTLTIGIGHTSAAGPPTVVPGMTITEQEAYEILNADLKAVEAEVAHYIKVALHPNQFDAVTSFQYNTGWLSHPHCSLAEAINSGRTDLAADDFALYDRASGRVVKGLVRRRAAEAAIFKGEPYVGADGKVIGDEAPPAEAQEHDTWDEDEGPKYPGIHYETPPIGSRTAEIDDDDQVAQSEHSEVAANQSAEVEEEGEDVS